MFCGKGSYTIPITVFLALLIIVLPASAYTVAMYGTNAGFNPDLHQDTVTVVHSMPGSPGSDLDNAVDLFTQPSVDVIIIGGVDTFTPSTAAKLETAVAEGKILIITYPCNRLFDASLPATNGGSSPGGQNLQITDPSSAASKEIFDGLQAPFSLTGAAPDKEQVVARSGAVIVLDYDTGMPALIYKKYGKGYVIEWTTIPVPSYMTETVADTILDRLITRLLPVVPATTTAETVTATATSVVTTQLPVQTTTISQITTVPVSNIPTSAPAAIAGDVVVYSSPLGASILIDGIYYGTTPSNLTGISQGNHIIRLTQSGYYDYEGSLYVVAGQTAHAFGTLIPLNQVTAAPTAAPVIVTVVTVEPTATEEPGLLNNSNIIVAIIGVFTAAIAALATVFPHLKGPKKE
ncbi:MAG: PEGA domain-containing protein [Methanoregula sp.]|jgi:hypothetical protein|nr:PEGA domain-containing protein [Methanoregula sp.]